MSRRAILVLGRGVSGRAAEKLARALGWAVVVCDDSAPLPPRGGDDFACAVVSPGLALSHPLVVECRARGIPLKSELAFGCEELKRRGWKLLAVTGSKGKSSVVKLCADALCGVPCGNYGTPVCEVAERREETRGKNEEKWAVVEVSSFMMETTDLPADTFEAAAILNLQEDHLDRHGGVEVYHALKRKLLTMTRHPVDGVKADASVRALVRGSYFDNEVLRGNAAAAVSLLRSAGLDDARIRQAFLDFEPLPHRMNLIAEVDGVRYVDDSKATSLAALAAGVEMAASDDRPVLLIAGGLPKGDEPRSVLPVLTDRVKKVYLIGQCAEVFFAAWESAVDCEICGLMELAVRSARRDAVKGETVLLSPGTASYDQFKSFGERGDVFAALIKKERKDE